MKQEEEGGKIKYYSPNEVEIVVEDGVRKAYVKPPPEPPTPLFIKLSKFIDHQFMQRGFNSDKFATALLEKFNVTDKEIKEMKQVLDINKQEEEERSANPPKLTLITGGKQPPDDPDNPDWLSKLDNHTTFLVQKRNDSTFSLGQFTIVIKLKKAILLLMEGAKTPLWVDPMRFCRDFNKFEIVQTGEEYDLEVKANAMVKEIFQSNDGKGS
jgi:hypothetical protein